MCQTQVVVLKGMSPASLNSALRKYSNLPRYFHIYIYNIILTLRKLVLRSHFGRFARSGKVEQEGVEDVLLSTLKGLDFPSKGYGLLPIYLHASSGQDSLETVDISVSFGVIYLDIYIYIYIFYLHI